MATKKLSTKPIKIEVPGAEKPDSFNQDSFKTETQILDSFEEDNVNPVLSLLENINEEIRQPLISKEEEEKQKPEKSQQDSLKPDVCLQDSSKLLSTKIENSNSETSLLEYKKVAMRLSLEAAERLRQFRGDTGIPYEILVDVMIRHWDDLPQKTQTAYLKESKKVRAQRLLAGQQKALETVHQKYGLN